MKHSIHMRKGKLSHSALMTIFLEEARRILDDDDAARSAAEEAIRNFSRNYPQMVKQG